MRTMLALAVAILLLAPVSASAKVLYVNRTTGSDATSYADNGPSTPWATLGRAAWGNTNRNTPNPAEAARAGDTVIVAAGTYSTTGTNTRYTPAYNPVNSGTAGNPITFQASGTVNLVYSGGIGPVIGATGKNYITWKGFAVDEATAPGAADTGPAVLWSTVGSVIEDCELDGNGDTPPAWTDNHVGLRIVDSSYVTVRNNYIHDFYCHGVNATNGAGIQVYDSGSAVFEHNEIAAAGSGIFIKQQLGDIGRYTVRYNLVRDVTVGMIVHRAPNTPGAPIDVYQNVFHHASASGMQINAFDSGASDPRHAKFVNNTIHDCNIGFLVPRDLVSNAGHLFWNNIVSTSASYAVAYAHEGGAHDYLTEASLDLEHNLYWSFSAFANVNGTTYTLADWKRTFGQDTISPASLSADPLFVNAAQHDFRLQAGSPARNLGADVLDLNNNRSTTDVIPVGAYVSGNEIIGRTPAPSAGSPSAPSGVRVIR